MEQNWEQWRHIIGLESKYNIDSIESTIRGGFKILLSETFDKKKRVTFTFKNGIYAHREADKKIMNHTMSELVDNYDSAFYEKWTFFNVSNSLYLKWLSDESYGLIDSLLVKHFSIIASNKILDIAYHSEPVVEITL